MKETINWGKCKGQRQSSLSPIILFYLHKHTITHTRNFKTFNHCQVAPMVKNLPAKAGDVRDTGLIPGLGRSPGGGHGNPLQYSCLENPMDRGAWRATVHGVTKSPTGLSDRAHRHSCFMRLCSLLLNNKVNQPCTCTYPLLNWISFLFRSPQSTE